MSARWMSLILLGLMLVFPSAAVACLWDYETLRQERARFPSTLELITGKFLRHSPNFYEWRIQDRLKKLANDPQNIALLDDLAVAYEKTGQHALAIETILKKEAIKPGLYETYSNLGTFHILAGDFEKGLPYIDKALEINPEAHFGREKYQKWLVEYAMERRVDGKLVFPMRRIPGRTEGGLSRTSFLEFLTKQSGGESLPKEEVNAAVKGVLGMMRFANHTNPLLLEALGDLLSDEPFRGGSAEQLAARCYLKASMEVKNPESKQGYLNLVKEVLSMQKGTNDSQMQAEFTRELAGASTWYSQLKDRELGWIKNGKDVEAEFDRLYVDEPEVVDVNSRFMFYLLIAAAIMVTCFVGIFLRQRKLRLGRLNAASAQQIERFF